MSVSAKPPFDPAPSSPVNRITRTLLIGFGILWGLWYFGMDQIGWGEPGSQAYERYELYNRLLPLVLLPLAAGLLGARRLLKERGRSGAMHGASVACVGLGVMVVGSVLEFWWFTLAPYAPGSMRGLGWTTYCVGLLTFFLGTARLGIALRQLRRLRLAAGLLATWLPAALLVAGFNHAIGSTLPPLSIATALVGLGMTLLGVHLPSVASPAFRVPA